MVLDGPNRKSPSSLLDEGDLRDHAYFAVLRCATEARHLLDRDARV